MVIEYQIKRLDMVKAYFHNLRHSRRTQVIMFSVAIISALLSLFIRYLTDGNLEAFDFIYAICFGLFLILLVPVISYLTAKTQKRTLSINQEGIETKIGTQGGKIPWQAVDSIATTEDHIFITGRNANAFTIPASAFANPDLRNQFIEFARQYLSNSKI